MLFFQMRATFCDHCMLHYHACQEMPVSSPGLLSWGRWCGGARRFCAWICPWTWARQSSWRWRVVPVLAVDCWEGWARPLGVFACCALCVFLFCLPGPPSHSQRVIFRDESGRWGWRWRRGVRSCTHGIELKCVECVCTCLRGSVICTVLVVCFCDGRKLP